MLEKYYELCFCFQSILQMFQIWAEDGSVLGLGDNLVSLVYPIKYCFQC
jgi:hypothetical protein